MSAQRASCAIAASATRSTCGEPGSSISGVRTPPRPHSGTAGEGTRMNRFSSPSGAVPGSVAEVMDT